MRALALAATFASVLAWSPAGAQSDKTCIGYMEADAVYNSNYTEAQKSVEAACQPYAEADRECGVLEGALTLDDMTFSRVKKTPCGKLYGPGFLMPGSEGYPTALAACEEARAECKRKRDSHKPTCVAAHKFFEATKVILNGEYRRAVLEAYDGERSLVTSVMNKLLVAEIKRCNRRM